MSSFFSRMNKKVNELIEDENSVLSKAKKSLHDKAIKVPINANMMMYLIQKKKIEGVEHLQITMENECLQISGAAKKLLLTLNFRINLMPIRAEGRSISFRVIDMEPMNNAWIKKLIFNKPPAATYKDDIISLDLNQIDKIKQVKIGTIKSFVINDNKLWCSIGL